MYRIGVDLGGTNISVGVVDEDFNIIGRGKTCLLYTSDAADE